MSNSCIRRITKEIGDLQKGQIASFFDLTDFTNVQELKGVIKPTEKPYAGGKFSIDITFPNDYPFKPPKITFRTPIYHPNVNEKGEICLGLINPESWRPATKLDQVMQGLLALIHDPEPEHALRGDVGDEYTNKREQFMKAAAEHTLQHANK